MYIYILTYLSIGLYRDRSGYIGVYWGYEVILDYNIWLYRVRLRVEHSGPTTVAMKKESMIRLVLSRVGGSRVFVA